MGPGLSARIARSADPAAARTVVERLVDERPGLGDRLEADPRLAAALVATTAASRSLGRLLTRDRAAVEVLAALDDRVARPEGPSGADAVETLVRWKEHEYLRIAALDLTDRIGLDTTAAALARLAADVLERATEIITGGAGGLAIIGMGKLGGSELNYASDIDIVFVADGEPDDAARWARAIVEAVGHCFRVDTALRPEGRDGPLVRSLASFEAYWERWAQPWEHQALIKAQPVAGDDGLGRRWLDAATHHLWNRPFSADDLRSLRDMKRRTEAIAMPRNGAIELKRTPGGIRDIEFATQLLQLVHGQQDPALRAPSTVAALHELGAAGYVDPVDADWLTHAYRFLRRCEHALQLEDEQQTHTVPRDRQARQRVARIVGFRDSPHETAVAAFDRELSACRATVRHHYEELWFRPLLEAFTRTEGHLAPDALATRLAAFGFTDVDRTRQAVAELTRGLTRSSRLMQQFLPLLLDWLSSSPDPDLGLLSLRRLVADRARAARVAAAFRDSPEVARRLCLLLGTSRWIGDLAILNSDLLGELGAPESPRRSRDELTTDATSSVGWRADPAARARSLRHFCDRELLRVTASDVLGAWDTDDTGGALTELADALVGTCLQILDPSIPFVVVAMGRYGGRSLSYASDLDVVFVYEHDGSSAAQAAAEADRVATGFVRLLRGPTPAERIWDVDADLRPEGRDGPLARSLDGFATYFDGWAQPWERQAMTQARPIAGPIGLQRAFTELVTPWVTAGLSPEAARDIRRMKARVERERIPADQDPAFHLKLGRGSLSDIEWTTQLLQLQHRVPGAGTTATLHALLDRDVIEPADATPLLDAYRFCEQTRNRLFLTDGRAAADALPARPDRLAALAHSLGTTAPELREEYRRVTRRARRVVERLFYGQS